LILLPDCLFPLPAIASPYPPAMIIQSYNDKQSLLGEMIRLIRVIAKSLPIAEEKS